MKRLLIIIAIVLAFGVVVSPSFGDWLYDGTPILGYGPAIGQGYSTKAVAQSFSFTSEVQVDQIGLAIGKLTDPDNVDFKVTLTEDYSNIDKFNLGTWSFFPDYGGSLLFTYQSITPLILKPDFNYYLVIEPGDTLFSGGIAYTSNGSSAYTFDGKVWNSSAPFGLRIGGTVVPEPSVLSTLLISLIPLSYLIRKNR